MRSHLPALSHWFGLRPADIDSLTFSEVRVYLDALEEIRRQREQQQKRLT